MHSYSNSYKRGWRYNLCQYGFCDTARIGGIRLFESREKGEETRGKEKRKEETCKETPS